MYDKCRTSAMFLRFFKKIFLKMLGKIKKIKKKGCKIKKTVIYYVMVV